LSPPLFVVLGLNLESCAHNAHTTTELGPSSVSSSVKWGYLCHHHGSL
jgi:hypothetical protein